MQNIQPLPSKRPWGRIFLAIYLLALLASHIVRWARPATNVQLASTDGSMLKTVQVQAINGDRVLDTPITLAYREWLPAGNPNAPAVLLFHGSPGSGRSFRGLGPLIGQRYRAIALDLPGFGASTIDIPDYAFKTHAEYGLAFMDALGIPSAHVLGFSMGGGVVISMIDAAPQRIKSVTLLSAIGVQEMELIGDYDLNHMVHGAMLSGLWLIKEGLPHFGALDQRYPLSFAWNFYQSDQRPLRGILQRYAGPLLILQGDSDTQVPVEAAREHARIVPQSELKIYDYSHFLTQQQPAMLAETLLPFLERVEAGTAITRSRAEPQRIAEASQPYDVRHMPKLVGIAIVSVIALLALATLISEDLACISAGVLVAQGRLEFGVAVLACFLGIYVGDILIFLAGRKLGRATIGKAPLKWLTKPEALQRGSDWLDRRGIAVIIASRFMPGTRFATYFAAGAVSHGSRSLLRFAVFFFIAVALWTPLFVGAATVLGAEIIKRISIQSVLWSILLAALVIYALYQLLSQLITYRGRRKWVGALRSTWRWEFWPRGRFYPPVVLYVLWLALRHRSLTVFTAANPAIPAGGIVGESKYDILQRLNDVDNRVAGFVASFDLIRANPDIEKRIAQAQAFRVAQGCDYPIVLKPDVGERGSGVSIIRSDEQLRIHFANDPSDTIIQSYAPGDEFGVFYYRYPHEAHGHIFAITEKRMPVVTGDGVRTLERLILDDTRAVCMADYYINQQPDVQRVPAQGERVQLVELGTHSRGCLFLDGAWVNTLELEAAIDQVSQRFAGFYFGRYDIRTPNVEDFKHGRNFKVLELNGVSSEATMIYDPKHSLLDAYRILFKQWRIAFEIGAANVQRGSAVMTLPELVRWLSQHR